MQKECSGVPTLMNIDRMSSRLKSPPFGFLFVASNSVLFNRVVGEGEWTIIVISTKTNTRWYAKTILQFIQLFEHIFKYTIDSL